MLADTSVWIDHFRNGNRKLADALEQDDVQIHEFVIGELACGNLGNRDEILELLSALPVVERVLHDEVLAFVHARNLSARGLGWIDVHLLAACVAGNARLFTLDSRLRREARTFGLSAD